MDAKWCRMAAIAGIVLAIAIVCGRGLALASGGACKDTTSVNDCPWDFDGDRYITVVDIMTVASHWHQYCTYQEAWPGLKGVCYCGGQAEDVISLGAWGTRAGPFQVPGVDVTVPQIGPGLDEAAVRQYARDWPGTNWRIFLEPDQLGLTPKEASYFYAAITNIILSEDPSAQFVCCGVSQLSAMTWEDAFIAEYEAAFGQPPEVHGWATHYYPGVEGQADAQTYFQRLQAHMTAYQAWAGGTQVWLTEWSLLEGGQTAMDYVALAVPWLESQGIRFSWWCTDLTWFGAPEASLLRTDGGLTPLGEAYAQ